MFSKLSMNGVLASNVDYFCLVCECRLRDEDDAAGHIAKPVHTKKFDLTKYFENEKEFVRKIKKWYLCELCNLTLPTAARVRLHVLEPTHVKNRVDRVLQRKGSCVVAFSNVQVEDRAWNGMVDDTCAICNTEFNDEHIHRNETRHVLNLIQSKVEFDETQNLFRRLDESTFHCITCNKVVAMNAIDVHFNEVEHKNLYRNCCDQNNGSDQIDVDKFEIGTEKTDPVALEITENIQINGVQKDAINVTCQGVDAEMDEDEMLQKVNSDDCTEIINPVKIDAYDIKNMGRENILDLNQDYQNKDININNESQTAVCKKCAKELDFQVKAIEDHIKEHIIDDVDVLEIQITNEIETIDNGEMTTVEELPSDEELPKVETLPHDNEFSHDDELPHVEELPHDKELAHVGESAHVEELSHDEEIPHVELASVKELPSLVSSIKDEEQEPKKIKANTNKIKSPLSASTKEAINFANKNDMKYCDNENKVYCNKCKVNIPTSLKCLQEHVSGSNHLKAMHKHNTQVALFKRHHDELYDESFRSKMIAETFIESTVHINGVVKAVVINDNICINLLSFEMMVEENNSLRCLICQCKVLMHNFDSHRKSTCHDKLLTKSFVMTGLGKEFVREIRPNSFHCGLCNSLHTPWSALLTHMQSSEHNESKSSAFVRLQRLMPDIIRFRRQQQFDRMMNVVGFMFDRNRFYDSDSD